MLVGDLLGMYGKFVALGDTRAWSPVVFPNFFDLLDMNNERVSMHGNNRTLDGANKSPERRGEVGPGFSTSKQAD